MFLRTGIFYFLLGPNSVLSLYSRMIEVFDLWLIQWCGFQKVGCCRLPTESYRLKLQVPEPQKSSTKLHRTTPNLVTLFSLVMISSLHSAVLDLLLYKATQPGCVSNELSFLIPHASPLKTE